MVGREVCSRCGQYLRNVPQRRKIIARIQLRKLSNFVAWINLLPCHSRFLRCVSRKVALTYFPSRVSFWPLPAPMFSLFLPRLPSPFINCSFSTNDVIWLAFFCGLLLLFLTGPINLTRLSSFYRIKNCFRRHHPVPSILAPHCLRCSECRQQSVNEKSHHENSTSNKLLINTQRTGVCMKVLSVFLVVVCAKRHFSKINVKEKLSFSSCCCFSNSNRI